MHDWREAVRGAGRVGNDVMHRQIELLIVHAHHDGDVFTLRRSGDDDLLGPSGDVALGLVRFGEETGGLDHELDAQFGPRELGGRARGNHEDFPAVDDEDVVLDLIGRRLLGADGAGELALRRVILEQVGKIVGGDDVSDGDDVERRSEQALFHECAENQATDATETVDCDFYCHVRALRLLLALMTMLVDPRERGEKREDTPVGPKQGFWRRI